MVDVRGVVSLGLVGMLMAGCASGAGVHYGPDDAGSDTGQADAGSDSSQRDGTVDDAGAPVDGSADAGRGLDAGQDAGEQGHDAAVDAAADSGDSTDGGGDAADGDQGPNPTPSTASFIAYGEIELTFDMAVDPDDVAMSVTPDRPSGIATVDVTAKDESTLQVILNRRQLPLDYTFSFCKITYFLASRANSADRNDRWRSSASDPVPREQGSRLCGAHRGGGCVLQAPPSKKTAANIRRRRRIRAVGTRKGGSRSKKICAVGRNAACRKGPLNFSCNEG